VVRPKKPASQRKETVIKIRVTDADKRAFETAAAASSTAFSTVTTVTVYLKGMLVYGTGPT